MDVIMVGHAETASAFKEAVRMIVGEVPNFHPLSFFPGEGLESLTAKIEKEIDPKKVEKTLIVVDLFSGTPYNAAAGLVLHHQAKDVVAGMCLPILLELAMTPPDTTVQTAVTKIEQEKSEYVKVLSTVLAETAEEDDF